MREKETFAKDIQCLGHFNVHNDEDATDSYNRGHTTYRSLGLLKYKCPHKGKQSSTCMPMQILESPSILMFLSSADPNSQYAVATIYPIKRASHRKFNLLHPPRGYHKQSKGHFCLTSNAALPRSYRWTFSVYRQCHQSCGRGPLHPYRLQSNGAL